VVYIDVLGLGMDSYVPRAHLLLLLIGGAMFGVSSFLLTLFGFVVFVGSVLVKPLGFVIPELVPCLVDGVVLLYQDYDVRQRSQLRGSYRMCSGIGSPFCTRLCMYV